MDLKKAMQERHSVRSYLDKPIESGLLKELTAVIDECNADGGLHIQLVVNEPKAFDGFMAHYGKFSGVKNYVALVGGKGKDEKIGYYGEKIVLAAQALGLNTCWVAMTYKKIKTAFAVGKGEKLYCVLALGYGATQGVAHKSKSESKVSVGYDSAPESFKNGVKAALLAPTAVNQQKFTFSYENGEVTAKAGVGFYSKIDLGIAKYHFELGSGTTDVNWI
ncbi:MAG: nitroreductase family protein [Christensenellales bacterium]